jgi:hypothetical protein
MPRLLSMSHAPQMSTHDLNRVAEVIALALYPLLAVLLRGLVGLLGILLVAQELGVHLHTYKHNKGERAREASRQGVRDEQQSRNIAQQAGKGSGTSQSACATAPRVSSHTRASCLLALEHRCLTSLAAFSSGIAPSGALVWCASP